MNINSDNDIFWMTAALHEAQKAGTEVPIGAVIVCDNQLIASAFNERETTADPTSHAEILAIRRASSKLNRWRLFDCTLYVTLEPCCMCAGAIVLARIPRVVFGTRDPKAGAVGSVYNLLQDTRLNHSCLVTENVLQAECSSILRAFFLEKRQKK